MGQYNLHNSFLTLYWGPMAMYWGMVAPVTRSAKRSRFDLIPRETRMLDLLPQISNSHQADRCLVLGFLFDREGSEVVSKAASTDHPLPPDVA
jgi:hypothetical protein